MRTEAGFLGVGEEMQAADEYLEKSRQMDRRKQELLYYYNHVMQNGKWEGILTPESFTPAPTVLYPASQTCSGDWSRVS